MKDRAGIVVKVTKKNIVLMMPDGTFRNVRRPAAHVPLLGERMEADDAAARVFSLKLLPAVAACVMLIIVFVLPGLLQIYPDVSYVIAIDINPSLEMQVDTGLKIKSIKALNADAENILRGGDFSGKDVRDALPVIIGECVRYGYLGRDGSALIAVSVVPAVSEADAGAIKCKNDIEAVLKTTVESNKINAVTEVENATMKELDEAHRLGMSVNRYVIYNGLLAEGIELSIEEAKNAPLGKLRNYKSVRGENSKNKEGQKGPDETVKEPTGKNNAVENKDGGKNVKADEIKAGGKGIYGDGNPAPGLEKGDQGGTGGKAADGSMVNAVDQGNAGDKVDAGGQGNAGNQGSTGGKAADGSMVNAVDQGNANNHGSTVNQDSAGKQDSTVNQEKSGNRDSAANGNLGGEKTGKGPSGAGGEKPAISGSDAGMPADAAGQEKQYNKNYEKGNRNKE